MTIKISKIKRVRKSAAKVTAPALNVLRMADPILTPESPVPHMSYSGMYTYFKSPAKFWDTYVAHKPLTPNLTMTVGRAWHKALECYYKGYDDAAGPALTLLIEEAAKLPEPPDKDELGAIVERLTDNLDDYFRNCPKNKTKDVEIRVKAPSPTPNGLPLKGQMDRTGEEKKILFVQDHKYVKSFAGAKPEIPGEENVTKKKSGKGIIYHYVQAWTYYHLYKHQYGVYPHEFRLGEYKQTHNRDHSPQYRETIVPYEQAWLKKIDKWYDDLCIQIIYQKRFVPNPFQMFDGEDWEEYLNT